ncbi:phytanoyl-CoA dioxygenase family protein [Actinophytocola glycyrrhizae]|uniref:Phytanoyl-CoA dioxygenase family protein n=1 Tax=Actinophytocola glycyrrhizae TaxID=2044873 RepID=A0ABV9S1D4_9PSEU
MTLTATAVVDRYPTRIDGDPDLIDRTDPSVWDFTGAGPIDRATVAAHHAKGFSIHHDLLSEAEVAACRDELARLATDPGLADDSRTLRTESGEVSAIYDVHTLSELVAELVCDPRVLDRARQVLGSDVCVHQSRIEYLPGFHGKGAYWHSPFETWHAEDGMPAPRAVSVSIPLSGQEMTGELMAMPGSHRTFVPTSRGSGGVPGKEHLTRLADAYGIERFTDAEGSLLMFDANLMQGSADNITPFPRTNIHVVFSSVENRLCEPFAGGEPRPAFIANRDGTPLHR